MSSDPGSAHSFNKLALENHTTDLRSGADIYLSASAHWTGCCDEKSVFIYGAISMATFHSPGLGTQRVRGWRVLQKVCSFQEKKIVPLHCASVPKQF